MPWEKLSGNKYQRPLDGSELCIQSLISPFRALDHEHWVLNTVAEITFHTQHSDQFEQIRKAWAHLRYEHPFVATTIDVSSNNFVYETLVDNEALQQWASRTCVLHKVGTAVEFIPQAGVPYEASVHFFTQPSEVMIRCSHILVDGRGELHLMNNFLAILASSKTQNWPVFGDEAERLSISPSEAAQWPTEITPAIDEQTNQMLHGMLSNPSMGLPIKSSQLPGKTVFVGKDVDTTTVNSLMQACKANSYGFTATVHAAVSKALFEQAGDSPSEIYAQVNNFDIRKVLPAPYNDPNAWPMGYWILSIPFRVHKSNSFAECAEYFTTVYKTPLTIDQNPMIYGYDAFCGKVAHVLSQPPPPDFSPPSIPLLSAWGEISNYIKPSYSGEGGQITVNYVTPLLDASTTIFAFVCSSWQGKMRLNTCYNEAWYNEGVAQYFLNRVHEILFEEFAAGKKA